MHKLIEEMNNRKIMLFDNTESIINEIKKYRCNDDNAGSGQQDKKNCIQEDSIKDTKIMRELPAKDTRIEGERESKNIRNDQWFES